GARLAGGAEVPLALRGVGALGSGEDLVLEVSVDGGARGRERDDRGGEEGHACETGEQWRARRADLAALVRVAEPERRDERQRAHRRDRSPCMSSGLTGVRFRRGGDDEARRAASA